MLNLGPVSKDYSETDFQPGLKFQLIKPSWNFISAN